MKYFLALLLALGVSVTANAKITEIKTIPQLIETLTKGPAAILITAEWCPGCKLFHPVYEKLSTQMSIQFLTADTDNPDIMPLTAGVPQIPTVMVLAVKRDKGGLKILGCLVDAPDTLEVVKTSVLKCLVEMK
jgi:thiol-disulfide isomerase/thioredoxin